MPWLPGAKLNKATVDGGSHVDVPWRLVIHTTESSGFHPSASSYFGHNSWPHITITQQGVSWQHIDTLRAARALARPSGSGPTNHARAIQIEVVGFAAQPDWPLVQLTEVRRAAKWALRTHGIRDVVLAPGPIAGSASASAPQRLSPAAWTAYNGICAHRHVPWNTHWDSGAFNLASLIPDKEGFMADLTERQQQELYEWVQLLVKGSTERGVVPVHIATSRIDRQVSAIGEDLGMPRNSLGERYAAPQHQRTGGRLRDVQGDTRRIGARVGAQGMSHAPTPEQQPFTATVDTVELARQVAAELAPVIADPTDADAVADAILVKLSERLAG